MKNMKKFKELLKLFLIFFKIGLFTFGGGYAMIPLIKAEFTEKRDWISSAEFSDILAIAESTPGPLAVNLATYVGYKRGKFLGALASTFAVVLPSFIIIMIISLFLDKFLENGVVRRAFRGIQCAVAVIILFAGVNMLKDIPRRPVFIILFLLTLGAVLAIDILSVNFSCIFFILFGALVGVVEYLIMRAIKKGDKK